MPIFWAVESESISDTEYRPGLIYTSDLEISVVWNFIQLKGESPKEEPLWPKAYVDAVGLEHSIESTLVWLHSITVFLRVKAARARQSRDDYILR